MANIEILDETIRQGQQALWGMRMKAGMALPIADTMDRSGFRVIDFTGSSMFEVLVKYCQEDPWEGVDLIRSRIRDTPLRGGMRSNACVTFGVTPDALMDCWMRRLNEHGLRSFWIYDCAFNFDKIARLAGVAKEYGSEVAGTVFYTSSPVHTNDYLAGKAGQLAAIPDIDHILFYDTTGTLDIDRARLLIPMVVAAAGEKPVEFHSNNIMGMSGQMYVEAVKAGVQILHTASRPLANSFSMPSTESVVRNLELLGHTHGVDKTLLAPVADHFRAVGKAAGYTVDPVSEYDLFSVVHQVPGGMAGTLRAQLDQHQMPERLDEVLAETARVREEMGWPIMATPFSQLVGTVSVLNVVNGERWGLIPDEVIAYAAGHYGPTPAPIAPDVLDRIMAWPRATEIAATPPEQPTIEELRKRHETNDDDELILRALLPRPAIDAMRASGPVKREFPLSSPQIEEIKTLIKSTRSPYARVSTEEFSLELRR